jgi:hypothetical protein
VRLATKKLDVRADQSTTMVHKSRRTTTRASPADLKNDGRLPPNYSIAFSSIEALRVGSEY